MSERRPGRPRVAEPKDGWSQWTRVRVTPETARRVEETCAMEGITRDRFIERALLHELGLLRRPRAPD